MSNFVVRRKLCVAYYVLFNDILHTSAVNIIWCATEHSFFVPFEGRRSCSFFFVVYVWVTTSFTLYINSMNTQLTTGFSGQHNCTRTARSYKHQHTQTHIEQRWMSSRLEQKSNTPTRWMQKKTHRKAFVLDSCSINSEFFLLHVSTAPRHTFFFHLWGNERAANCFILRSIDSFWFSENTTCIGNIVCNDLSKICSTSSTSLWDRCTPCILWINVRSTNRNAYLFGAQSCKTTEPCRVCFVAFAAAQYCTVVSVVFFISGSGRARR